MRRPYEMKNKEDYYKDFVDEAKHPEERLDVFGLEVKRTDLQPNYRKNRSLRTVQGMDFVYQLRGMEWVRFYDVNAEDSRANIRDWSFIQDINIQAKMKKSDSMVFKSEIENLLPLTGQGDFDPHGDIMELVKSFYDNRPVWNVSVGGSDTSSDSSASSVSGDSSDTSPPSSPDGSPSHSICSPRVITKPSKGKAIEVIELDDDVEMGDDDDDELTILNGPNHNFYDSSSSSGSSSRPSSSSSPKSDTIVIPDDDDEPNDYHSRSGSCDISVDDEPNEHHSRSGSCDPSVCEVSSNNSTVYDGPLFVRPGSCSPPVDNLTSRDEEGISEDRRTPDPFSQVVDFTQADDDDDDVMEVDRSDIPDEVDGNDDDVMEVDDPDAPDEVEVKGHHLVDGLQEKKEPQPEEDSNQSNDDDTISTHIKIEATSSRHQSTQPDSESDRAPSKPDDSILDDNMLSSIKPPPWNENGSSSGSCKRSSDDDGSD